MREKRLQKGLRRYFNSFRVSVVTAIMCAIWVPTSGERVRTRRSSRQRHPSARHFAVKAWEKGVKTMKKWKKIKKRKEKKILGQRAPARRAGFPTEPRGSREKLKILNLEFCIRHVCWVKFEFLSETMPTSSEEIIHVPILQDHFLQKPNSNIVHFR